MGITERTEYALVCDTCGLRRGAAYDKADLLLDAGKNGWQSMGTYRQSAIVCPECARAMADRGNL